MADKDHKGLCLGLSHPVLWTVCFHFLFFCLIVKQQVTAILIETLAWLTPDSEGLLDGPLSVNLTSLSKHGCRFYLILALPSPMTFYSVSLVTANYTHVSADTQMCVFSSTHRSQCEIYARVKQPTDCVAQLALCNNLTWIPCFATTTVIDS